VIVPVQLIVMTLLFALLSYVVISIVSERANFKKYFTLYLYGWIPFSIGTMASMMLSREKLDSMGGLRSIDDVMATFGLGALFTTESNFVKALLGSFDIFAIWFYVLVGLGVIHVFRVSRHSAAMVVAAVWVPIFLYTLVGLVFA